MADKADLRVSDADREGAASRLREHYAAGRLDSSEFEERLQAIYAARTESELESLSADLPALPPKPPSTRELLMEAVGSHPVARNAGVGVAAFAACTAIWALTGAHSSFWPKWVLVVTLIAVVRGIKRGGWDGGGRYRGRGGGRIGPSHHYSYHYEYHHGDGRRRTERERSRRSD